jgi:phage terminase small subunit
LAKKRKKSKKAQPTDSLSKPERDFVTEYMRLGQTATGAYRLVFPDACHKTCQVKGSAMLKRPRVAAEIKFLQEQRRRRYEVTNDNIIRELSFVAFLDIGDFLYDDGTPRELSDIPEEARRALATVSVEQLFDGRGERRRLIGNLKKIGAVSKAKALELLVKIQGLITEKHEHSASEDLASLLTKARRRTTVTSQETELEVLLS